MAYQGFLPTDTIIIGARDVIEHTILDGAGVYTVDAATYGYAVLTVEGDTNFTFDFGSPTVATDVIVEFILDANHDITFGDSSQPIKFPSGSVPDLTTGISLIKFHQNSLGDVYAEVLGVSYS